MVEVAVVVVVEAILMMRKLRASNLDELQSLAVSCLVFKKKNGPVIVT